MFWHLCIFYCTSYGTILTYVYILPILYGPMSNLLIPDYHTIILTCNISVTILYSILLQYDFYYLHYCLPPGPGGHTLSEPGGMMHTPPSHTLSLSLTHTHVHSHTHSLTHSLTHQGYPYDLLECYAQLPMTAVVLVRSPSKVRVRVRG